MARMRVFLVFVLAIGSGGALALATYNYVQNLSAAQTVTIPTRPVVVAARDLEIGAELKSDDVRVVEWPANGVPQGAIERPEEVIGRGVVLPFIQYEPILMLKLAAEGTGAGLPPAIPPGLRAVSVRVDEVIGVAGYVVPGTRVDVVTTISPGGQAEVMSKVVLTDVQVVAAGTKIDNTERDKPMPVSVVTLLVNPDEAERLTLAAGEGKIQLALRNPLDRERPATNGVRPTGLLSSAPPVRQVAPRRAQVARLAAAAPAPTVEIIRGDKREQAVVIAQEQ